MTFTLSIKIWSDDLPTDLSDVAELFAPHAEHVADLCRDGFQAGEIIDDTFKGWWSIEEQDDGPASNRGGEG